MRLSAASSRFAFTRPTPKNARFLNKAKREGATVQELTIVTGVPMGITWSFMTNKKFSEDALMDAAYWNELFACFPNLERLGIAWVELSLVAVILRSASTLCPRVRGLDLQGGSPLFGQRQQPDETAKLNHALADTLQAWHTSNGGLRAFTMPCWARYDDDAHAEVLSALASFCPALEYVRTWNYAELQRSNQARPHQVPIDVWSEFCRRCTALRSFSWNLCVFTPDHVQQFVQRRKPQLTSLEIELYIREWGHAREFSLIQSVFESVPTLQSLTLTLVDASARRDEEAHDANGDINAGLNELVQSVPRHCPQLSFLSCKVRSEAEDVLIHAMAIEALVRAPSLRELHMNRCHFDDDSIVEMFRVIGSESPRSRTLVLETPSTPHTPIVNALKFFAAEPRDRFTKTLLLLRIESRDYWANVHAATRSLTAAEQSQLVRAAQEQHALALCHVETEMGGTMKNPEKKFVKGLTIAMGYWVPKDDDNEDEQEDESESPPVRRSARIAGERNK